MDIIARYDVTFMLIRDGREPQERTAYPVLTRGYSTFEDIRKMIANVNDVTIDGIDVLSLVKVPNETAAGADDDPDQDAENDRREVAATQAIDAKDRDQL